MSAPPRHRLGHSQRGSEESGLARLLLVLVALTFCTIFLVLPLLNLFVQAFAAGLSVYRNAILDPDTLAAIRLTLTIAGISVPLNLIFGVAASWCIGKFEFKGKALLITLIDLPFAISPVAVGLMLFLLFGRQGIWGPWLDEHNLQIIFAVPGMVLATVFVTFPFIARELIPVMQATGSEQEQAALTLGANGWQTFWHVTLPSVKWALLYGVILCNARAMGEFGAVSIVSGHITGLTDTLPLRVEKLHQGASQASTTAAFAVATLLALLAVLTLAIKTFLEWRGEREQRLGQEAVPAKPRDDFLLVPNLLRGSDPSSHL